MVTIQWSQCDGHDATATMRHSRAIGHDIMITIDAHNATPMTQCLWVWCPRSAGIRPTTLAVRMVVRAIVFAAEQPYTSPGPLHYFVGQQSICWYREITSQHLILTFKLVRSHTILQAHMQIGEPFCRGHG